MEFDPIMDDSVLRLLTLLFNSVEGWLIIVIALTYFAYITIRPIVGTKAERILDKRLGQDFERLCDRIDRLCDFLSQR